MINKKYKELRNIEIITKSVEDFSQTRDMFYLAELYIGLEKIFKDEDFPISKYKIARKNKEIKLTKVYKQKYNVI